MDELGEFAEDPRVWPTTGTHFLVRPGADHRYYTLLPEGDIWHLYDQHQPMMWAATAAQVLSEAIGDPLAGVRERHEDEVYLLVHALRMGGWLTTLGMNDEEAAWAALLDAEGLMVFVDIGTPRYALTEPGLSVAEELRG